MKTRWLVLGGALVLAGCGGSNGDGTGGGGGGASSGGASNTSAGGSGGGDGGHTPTPLGKTFATIEVDDASGGGPRDDVPVTFGEPFAPGDVPKGATVLARIGDETVPLQVDAKATHADGSLRHAVLTANVPHLAGAATLELAATKDPPASGKAPTPADVLATSFDATVSATIGGKAWSASARDLLKKAGAKPWISGPLATEWALVAPLANGGDQHPHLTARFDVRAYAGTKTIWVSATVENDWAYQDAPQNFTYDAKLATDTATILAEDGLVHYRQARWRKAFFWGAGPGVGVKHDVAYLMETASLPNFDPKVSAAEDGLAALGAASGDDFAPMKIGLATAYMPETGGRGDIGPLPSWGALATISQDPRAKKATYGTGDAAGSWSIHYRDRKTDRPVSLDDHPYMTLLGNPGDACNPKTNTCDDFPDCGGDCDSPYSPDSAHQPSLAYLPYLLTGERYYLEELQFWANWNMLQANPAYREQEKGLLHWDQVRGQGWSMRTLGQAAYVTPDDDPLKDYFVKRVGFNLAWYAANYPKKADANALGFLDSNARGDDGTIAPWMDDFFTWSVGYVFDLGFTDAKAIRDWKVKYQVGRMTDPGYCWISASVYHMNVEDPATQKLYGSWAEAYRATLAANGDGDLVGLDCGGADMAAKLMLEPGEMVGYADSAEGYPSNLQPALAIAAEADIPNAKKAWQTFTTRPVKPDYSTEPQFAIVPR